MPLLINSNGIFRINRLKTLAVRTSARKSREMAEITSAFCDDFLIPDIVRDIFIRGFSDKISDFLRQKHRVRYLAMFFQHTGN